MVKSKLLIVLVLSLFLSFNASAYHQCYDTTVNHDTHYHGDGTSGGEAYQDWHASFAQYRSHRGRSSTCGGSSPNYIDISDDDGNSDRVNSPGDNYRVWTSDYSWLEGGDQVTVYYGGNDGATTSSVTRTMPNPNTAPSVSNPVPSDGSRVEAGTVSLSVDISDPDSSSIDLRFYDASDNSLIGSETVSNGETASTDWDVDSGQTYNWYVEAEDGYDITTSSTWSFDTNDAPTASNPNPSDGATINDPDPQISALYSDSEGDSGTLTFYNASGTTIGSCPVNDGDRCGVDWSTAEYGENEWYVEASDSYGASSTSSTWSFVINRAPNQASSPSPDGGVAYERSVTFSVDVSDPDGDSMDVEFLNNQSNLSNSERIVSDVADGGTASVDMDGLSRGQTYKWWVNISDGAASTRSGSWTFFANELPRAYDEDPADEGVSTPDDAPSVEVSVISSDSTSDDVTTYYFDGNDNLLGKVTDSSGARTEMAYPNTQIGETYEWYVEVSDGRENFTSNKFSFKRVTSASYRIRPGIEYTYSDVIISETGSREVFFNVENQIDSDKELRTYIEGVNATFAENNQATIDYVLEGASQRQFIVNIDPESSGSKTLRIITENQEYGINTTTSIPVTVKNFTDVSGTSEVPGIGTIQLIMLLLVSAYLYSVRL